MKRTHHLVAGAAMGIAAGSVLYGLSDLPQWDSSQISKMDSRISWIASWMSGMNSWVSGISDHIVDYLMIWNHPMYWMFVSVIFLVGTVLPDVDQKLKIAHRGITHTDFFVIALLLLGIIPVLRWMMFLAFGVMTHLRLDGLSRAGRVRFYPFQKYKMITYKDGTHCVVKSGRHRGYTVGTDSEKEVFVLVICKCVLISLLVLFITHIGLAGGPGNCGLSNCVLDGRYGSPSW